MGIFSNIFDRQSSSPKTPVTDFPNNDDGTSAPSQVVEAASEQQTTPSDSSTASSVATPSPAGESATPSPVVSADNEQQVQTPPSPSVPDPQNGTQGVSFTQQPTAEVAQVTPGQGIQIDWSKPYSQIEQNPILRQMTPYDIMKDYSKNGDGKWSEFMPWLSKYGDPDKTVEANDILAKKAERQAKWEQLGNLFSHIGNFVGTAIGAPSQQIESAKELTERQRKIRESTDALRQKGYDQMMVNIWKERQDKQAQMQADAAAKAKQAQAEYYGSQKNQVDALTPQKVATEIAKQNASNASAGLSTAKTKTENELRPDKKNLLKGQTNNQNAAAADHRAGIAVKGAQVKHIKSQTEGQEQKNANQKDADDFNNLYANDPEFKKHADRWANNNGMAVGNNRDDGKGGTWANEKNRQQATKWAKEQMARTRRMTPPSRRNGGGGNSKVPPSRRKK